MRLLTILFLLTVPLFADFQYYRGIITQGDASVTIPFNPKAVFIYSTGQTADGNDSTRSTIMQGFCVPNGFQTIGYSHAIYNAGTNNIARRERDNTMCMKIYNSSHVLAAAATFDACTISGSNYSCSLFWSSDDTVDRQFHYIAWGGSDITVVAGSMTVNGSGTNGGVSTTTIGCQANAILFQWGGTSGLGTAYNQSFGFATASGTTNTGSIGVGAADAGTTGYRHTELSPLADIASNGSQWINVSLTIGATDFTLTNTTANSVTAQYMAMCGGTWHAKQVAASVGSATQNVAVSGFTPTGAIITGTTLTTNTPSSGTAARYSVGFGDADGGVAFNSLVEWGSGTTTSRMTTSAVFEHATGTAGAPTFTAVVGTVTGTADQLTLNLTTPEANNGKLMNILTWGATKAELGASYHPRRQIL
jgi:hypothetical protein